MNPIICQHIDVYIYDYILFSMANDNSVRDIKTRTLMNF